MAILSPGQIIKSNFAKFTESWEKTAGQFSQQLSSKF